MKGVKKIFTFIFIGALLVFTFSGCGSEAVTADSDNNVPESAANVDNNIPENGEVRQMGKISGIDGNSITVLLAEQSGFGMGGREFPDGERPEGFKMSENGELPEGFEPPADGQFPGEKPDNFEGGNMPEGMTPPDGDFEKGEKPEGFEGGFASRGELSFTEETMTITLSADIEITVNGEKASAENLAVDDIIIFAVDGETVKSITVMDMQTPAQAEE